jgi:ubiquitin C-terminal hydrolase
MPSRVVTTLASYKIIIMPSTIRDFSAAVAAASDPSAWACETCGSSSDCWLALESGAVFCADDDHATAYAESLAVPFFIQISAPQLVKNQKTGATIRLGSRKSDDVDTVAAITTIRSRLQGLQTMGGARWASAKGWDKIRIAVGLFGVPFLTRASQLQRRRRDAQATALRRWLAFDTWRAFRSWQLKASQQGKAALAEAGQKRSREQARIDLSGYLRPAAPKTRLEQEARLGRTGLRNLGNTCYMNSTVQALAHVPLFRAFLFSLKAPTFRRVMDMLTSLTFGGREDEDPSSAASMPTASPVLTRLNSGLADLLEFGPTLSAVPKLPPIGESDQATSTGRRTRAKVTEPMEVPSLQSRQLTFALHEVVSRLFGFEPMAIYSPDAFLKHMWVGLPQFSGFTQQDAEEFVRALLNRLDDEAKANDSVLLSASKAMAHMFGGSACTVITCNTCKNVSRKEEPFFGPLSVEIPSTLRVFQPRATAKTTLEQCFDASFTKEVLEGDCAYECSKCQKKVSATMQRCLATVPPVAIVHVSRTHWATGSSKIQTHVDLPIAGFSLKPWLEGASENHADEYMYDVHSIVRHIGSSIKQGHYVAYARNDVKDTWHQFNDARVTAASDDEMEDVQGYMYFLQRRMIAT